MNARILASVLAILLVASTAKSAEDDRVGQCHGYVVDVATAEVIDKGPVALDIYAAARTDVFIPSGSVFKIFRRKEVNTGAGDSVHLYVGRLVVISVQEKVWVGRMLELAQRDRYPHVRYETVMVGDCLVLEHLPLAGAEATQPAPEADERSVDFPAGNAGAPPVSAKAGPAYHIITPKIRFRFDSAHIESQWHERLDEIAEFISQKQPDKVYVEGHACAIGSDTYNVGLSRRRAQAVVDYLVKEKGFAADLFEIQPFGERRPEEPNESAEGRKKNRRVYLYVPGETPPKVEDRKGAQPIAVDFDALEPEALEGPLIP
jgi:outer membrane protein OmpA-like peptidoglycan-associated protein